jgi:hypothetical protein
MSTPLKVLEAKVASAKVPLEKQFLKIGEILIRFIRETGHGESRGGGVDIPETSQHGKILRES